MSASRDSQNPFESPNSLNEAAEKSFWHRLKKFIFGDVSFRERFLKGDVVIQYGVMIFVDPENSHELVAAIPFGDHNESMKDVYFREAKKEVCKFLQKYPEVTADLIQRDLVIRLIFEYRDVDNPLCDKRFVDWYNEDFDGELGE